MQLKGKRVAILAENLYQEMELWVPYYRLKEEGAEVHVVGSGGAKGYTSKHGYPVSVDVQAEQVNAVEYDAVVIPGGFAPDLMRRSPAMVKLVRDAFRRGQGRGGDLPCGLDAGVGRHSQGQARDELLLDQGRLVNAGATWVDQEVVVDGNLITSRKPDDLPAFCREIVKALAKR